MVEHLVGMLQATTKSEEIVREAEEEEEEEVTAPHLFCDIFWENSHSPLLAMGKSVRVSNFQFRKCLNSHQNEIKINYSVQTHHFITTPPFPYP